jgi:excisionase family DNA binding protein
MRRMSESSASAQDDPEATRADRARSGTITIRSGSRATVIAPPRLISHANEATYVEMFDKQTLARYFRVSVDTIERLVKAGELPAVRIGNQVRFTLDDVDAFIERHRTTEEAA